MKSPFRYVIMSKYFIHPEKIIFQINAENFIEKSVMFKILQYILFFQNA